jgi:hypothetical protein
MKPLLLLFVASALIAQVPTQQPTARDALNHIRHLQEIAEVHGEIFSAHPVAQAYFRGLHDAYANTAEIVGRLVGPAYEPSVDLSAKIER